MATFAWLQLLVVPLGHIPISISLLSSIVCSGSASGVIHDNCCAAENTKSGSGGFKHPEAKHGMHDRNLYTRSRPVS
jgi:hypothetical protein